MTMLELKGYPCIELENGCKTPQSIQVSRSFGTQLYSLGDVGKPVVEDMLGAASRLRGAGLAAGNLSVYIRSGYRCGDDVRHVSESVNFETPVWSDIELVRAALALLGRIYRSGLGYTKAGVALYDLSEARYRQKELFSDSSTDGMRNKSERLAAVTDMINGKLGKRAIYPAILAEKDGKWRAKGEYRSNVSMKDLSRLPTIV